MFCAAFDGWYLCSILHRPFHRPHKIQWYRDRRRIDDVPSFFGPAIYAVWACHMVALNRETLAMMNRNNIDNLLHHTAHLPSHRADVGAAADAATGDDDDGSVSI